ncbi:MAG: MBL fold metallo-hydrolase [Acidimicrobiia bacterium]|nr:MBL fold metallo-hydrolase [Acidimicrobiia bacterium]
MTSFESVGDGVWRLPVPLPFASPRSVNSYAFESGDGLILLDCGVASDDGLSILRSALDDLGQLSTLIGSHLHVDHIGGAAVLVAETGARWVMHDSTPDDVASYNDWSIRTAVLAAAAAENGAPDDFVTGLRNRFERPDWYGTAVDPTHPVSDGDRIALGPDRYLEVLYTPGHQRNHICLIDSRTGVLYSGDHVLPRISPFVPYSGPESDHLDDYLSSIDRIERGRHTLTHPAHGPEIERGSERAHQIRLHHERRLESMLELLDERPTTAWRVMESTFRPNLNFLQQRLAFQETLAHLHYLDNTGRLRRGIDRGTIHYERTGR